MPKDSSPVPVRVRYRLTRLGVHFVFVAAFTMIGGALRGFNLLLVLAGLLIGALLVHWRCSRFLIQSTTVSRLLPAEAFAGTPFRIRYQVRNLSRYLPAWMIRIDDQINSPHEQVPTTAGCAVGVIGPEKMSPTFYDCVVTARGRYQLGPISLSTLFPFSLFLVRKTVDAQAGLHVFPALLSLRKGWQQTLVTKQGGAAAAARRSGPSEGDFFGLREWQTGDNPRWIHHRTTARVGEPIVRQFEQQRQFDACLLVDCYDPQRHRAEPTSAVETALSFAATIVASMDRAPANRLVLAVADDDPKAVSGGRVRGSKQRMLELLAEAAATADPKLVLAIDTAAIAAGEAKDLIVISSRDPQDVLRDHPEAAAIASRLQSWVRRGGLRWINVQSVDFTNWLLDRTTVPPAGTVPPPQQDDQTGEKENARVV